MLKDDVRTTSSITTLAGTARAFTSIRKCVLTTLNILLHNMQNRPSGYGLHVNFSKGVTGSRQSRFVSETWILSILEASHYGVMDMLSPFLGSIIDSCCGVIEHSRVTSSRFRVKQASSPGTYISQTVFFNNAVHLHGVRETWVTINTCSVHSKMRRAWHLVNIRPQVWALLSGTPWTILWTTSPQDAPVRKYYLREMGGIQYLHSMFYGQWYKEV